MGKYEIEVRDISFVSYSSYIIFRILIVEMVSIVCDGLNGAVMINDLTNDLEACTNT